MTVVHEETSYTWFLHDTLRAQLKADGEVEPKYDFVYIDGAHTWDVDALAFALADRLLVAGGWILFDDLDWVLDARWPNVPDYQRSLAQSRMVRFERVVDPVGERYEFSAEASRARTPTLAAPAPHYEHSGGASPTSATTSCSPTPIPRPR